MAVVPSVLSTSSSSSTQVCVWLVHLCFGSKGVKHPQPHFSRTDPELVIFRNGKSSSIGWFSGGDGFGGVSGRSFHGGAALGFRASLSSQAECAVDDFSDEEKSRGDVDEGLEISKLGISNQIVSSLSKRGITKLFPIQARFLKACGTIIETRAELRKAPEKVNDLLHCDGDSEPSNCHSWLPNILKEEDSNTCTLSGHLRESLEQADNGIPKSEVGMIGASLEKELNVESSLSSWLKPSSTNDDGNFHHSGSISIVKTQLGRTPWERPIIGMVAAHWNEVEPRNLTKYWDGNGIPNSTNKYKEDQKVSWQTPFEERLEKALSEETSIPQRVVLGVIARHCFFCSPEKEHVKEVC